MWLEKNAAFEKKIWLIYYKKHTGKPSIPYDHAVEEALCFGWIDSTVRRIDEERYMQQFTPRNTKSNWSELNIRRVESMIKAGKMTEAGLAKFNLPQEAKRPTIKKMEHIIIPEFISWKLQTNTTVWTNFCNLAPSHQRNYINWITSAKKQETREKRLKEAIAVLRKNQKLGMK